MQVTVSPDRKTILADIQGLIYAIPFTGGAGKQLTQPVQEASHPDWSSKGDLVALQSYAGGTFHIWTMKPDGAGLKQVTTGHGDDREPRISPDGSTIAFASDRAFKGSYDIWTVKTDGSDLKQITNSTVDEYEPNWSPDGKKLAFISGIGIQGASLEVVDLASGQRSTALSVDPAKGRIEAPSFSPDGTKISFVKFEGQGLFVNTAISLSFLSLPAQTLPTPERRKMHFHFRRYGSQTLSWFTPQMERSFTLISPHLLKLPSHLPQRSQVFARSTHISVTTLTRLRSIPSKESMRRRYHPMENRSPSSRSTSFIS